MPSMTLGFVDKDQWERTLEQKPLWSSKELESLWKRQAQWHMFVAINEDKSKGGKSAGRDAGRCEEIWW